MMMQFVSCFKIHGAVFFPFSKPVLLFDFSRPGKVFFCPKARPQRRAENLVEYISGGSHYADPQRKGLCR